MELSTQPHQGETTDWLDDVLEQLDQRRPEAPFLDDADWAFVEAAIDHARRRLPYGVVLDVDAYRSAFAAWLNDWRRLRHLEAEYMRLKDAEDWMDAVYAQFCRDDADALRARISLQPPHVPVRIVRTVMPRVWNAMTRPTLAPTSRAPRSRRNHRRESARPGRRASGGRKQSKSAPEPPGSPSTSLQLGWAYCDWQVA